MKRGQYFTSLAIRLLLTSITFAIAWTGSAFGGQSPQQEVNFQSNPVLNVSNSTPLVMLNLSKDQLLFFKAYNDFTALDPANASVVQTTYTDTIDYYGYFDSAKCYTYSASPGLFVPAATVSGYVSSSVALTGHACSGQWSGNFLNWASMTRMDAVRKLLYGGLRSTDSDGTTSPATVLERAFLPTDAHAFAKYYNGSDLANFVPFSASSDFTSTAISTTTSFTSSPVPLAYGGSPLQISFNINLASAANVQIGDQLCLFYPMQVTSADPTPCPVNADGTVGIPTTLTTPWNTTGDNSHAFIYGGVSGISGTTVTILVHNPSASTATLGSNCTSGTPCVWTVTNLSSPGVSLCNVSDPGLTGGLSQNVTTVPLLRVVRGNRALWAANEQLQCLWSSKASNTQGGFTGGFRSNGNRAFYSRFGANAENPDQTKVALGTGTSDTSTGVATGSYVVRVSVCPGGSPASLDANETCEKYGAGDEKPVGLLQKYAESGQIKFGLITGSFEKNISGGVVRKNLPPSSVNGINSLTDEISSGTSGTGQFLTPGANGGMIASLNGLKPVGYKFETGDSWGDGDNCPYQLSSIVHSSPSGIQRQEGNCVSWGSPLSEGYLESIRYLAGLSPSSLFTYTNGGSRDAALGLTQPAWPSTAATAVLDANNYCASLNVMNFNSSIESYDSWNLDSAWYAGFGSLGLTATDSSFPTASGADGWTKLVGDKELISGNKYFIGAIGNTTDGMCSVKTISDLSQASGICPEAPAKDGAYIMAGIAYASHIQRIRSDISVPATDTSSLKVTTYGVQLASNTPKLQIPKGDGSANIAFTILPAYRLDLGNGDGVTGPFGGGTLVDFRVVKAPDATCIATTTVPCTGSFYVNWEDSGQGGDFDQDMWGILNYEVTPSGINVFTQIVGLSSANGQGFGYVISGTDKDGPHFHSGGYNFKYSDPANVTVLNDAGTAVTGYINSTGGCNGCNLGDVRTHVSYNFGTATAQLLNDPMWYASKYGAFVDDPTTPTGIPDTATKWDKYVNATGASGPDGTPDDYFYVTNPAQLVSSLQRAFSQIVAKVASGTAAAVVANAAQGSGAVYQAFYEPVHQELITPSRQARWLGTLQALFFGPDGNLYEDNGGANAGKLVASDSRIDFVYDTAANVTKFNRTPDSGPGSNPHDLSDLKPIWNARKILATPATGVSVPQRAYSTGDTSKRYIFTWIDGNGDGIPTSSEIHDFTTAALIPADQFYFNLVNSSSAPTAATTEATNIVEWTRGEDLAGYRNRTLAYNVADGTAGAATQRLGDIIDSTPSIVATPTQAFDLLYGDQSYGVYRNINACRRQVVMVGANDGMLHAFNAGFYNVAGQAFSTTLNTTGCGTGSSGSQNDYALGEEIWAYVPQNLIPHLTWLTMDPPATNGYTHVYYVDGTPRIFDVNLPSVINHTCAGLVNGVSVDCSHWGTIAVVPFRLGGGDITVDIKGDGSVKRDYHSGYIVMDVTDPEVAPKLIAEITLPAGQLATSSPTVATIRKPDAGSGDPNGWFLVVGSGPDTRATVSSDTTASVNIYDLNNIGGYDSTGVTVPTKNIPVSGATNSFLGDLVASDWNLDFQAEGVYFGTQQTTASANFNGGMFKLQTHTAGAGAPDTNPASWQVYPMFAPASLANKSISIRPTLTLDDNSTPYVFVGTGRLFASADLGTTTQQSIFGFKDKSETLSHPTGCSGDSACVLDFAGNLLEGCSVQLDGTLTGACGSESSGTTFTKLTADATNNCLGTTPPTPCYDGWELDLTTPVAGDTHSGSERVVSSQTVLGGQLFTTTYIPNTSLCGAIGQSYLYSQDYRTGTASPGNASDFGTTTTGSTTTVNISNAIGSGGLASPPSLVVHPGQGANGTASLQSCVQTSTGQIVCKDLNPTGVPTNGEVSWRQLLNNN